MVCKHYKRKRREGAIFLLSKVHSHALRSDWTTRWSS